MKPGSEAELAELIQASTGPLSVVGGGTRHPGVDGQSVSTIGLTGVRLYEPGALTLVVGAGTTLAEIASVLDEGNQRLAFEPPDLGAVFEGHAKGGGGASTIGGVVAANASGPRRIQTGACRDHLLGVRFVDGTGRIIRNGGRVMKNVTGYDLVRLLCGSWGSLGVLSEVALKVLPRAETSASVLIKGLDVTDAVGLMSRALGSPWEVTGAAHQPGAAQNDGVTAIRIEGFEASVKERATKLASLLGQKHRVRIEGDDTQSKARWAAIRDATQFAGGSEDVWRISIRPSAAPQVVRRLPSSKVLLDWGGGLIWAGTAPGSDVRAMLSGIGGHATLVRAGKDTMPRLGRTQPLSPPLARITADLRGRFDPRGILNPGVMG